MRAPARSRRLIRISHRFSELEFSEDARVILDEAEVVGLAGVVGMNATMNIHTVDDQEFYKQRINFGIKERERSPKCDNG